MMNVQSTADHPEKIGERVDNNTHGQSTADDNMKLHFSIPEHTSSAPHGNTAQLEDDKNSSTHLDIDASASIRKGRKTTAQPYHETRALKPSPYFYYIDHTKDVDSDPLAPLTPTMSIPNFVIKMHAVLVCDSLSCVQWMPHGRSWKILNQSEFEKQVLPTYFTQGSIASFYRQANGWGFRRMLKGPDKGSFYNENFLRGLPFLAKKMKRIGHAKVFEGANIKHEPDLWRINTENPTPEELPKDSLDYIVLSTINKCVQEFGPKAKMPSLEGIETSSALRRQQAKLQILNERNLSSAQVTSAVPEGGRVHDSSSSVTASSSNILTTSGALTSNAGQVLAGQNSGLSHSQIESLLQQAQLQILNERSRGAQNLNTLQLIQAQQLQRLHPLTNIDSLLQILGASNHAAAPSAQQQQLMATVPAAYATNVSSSAGQYSSAPTAANNLAHTTSQMGLQTGYGRSLPGASFAGNSNTFGQIYPREAQQGTITNTGPRFESGNDILTSLLNNLSRSQSEPSTNSLVQLPRHPTIMPSQQTEAQTGLRFESVNGMLTNSLRNLSQVQSQPVTNSLAQLPQHPFIMSSEQTRQDQTNQNPSSAIIAMLLANLGTQHGQR